MTNSDTTKLAYQFISEPLLEQKIEGTVKLRFWARSLNLTNPATWVAAIRLISRDGKESRGELLPLTSGLKSDGFGSEMEAHIVGPFPLIPFVASKGDRIMLEIGSHGDAHIGLRDDDDQSCMTLSMDILFEDVQTALADTRVSRRIGHCIYCGRTNGQLSREHIIPEGLNGEWTLTEASCDGCAQITSRFEMDLLRNAFGSVRLALQMRTRRPAQRPRHLPLQVRRGDTKVSIPIPIEEYPAVIALPIFASPSYMNQDSDGSLRVVNARPIQIGGLPLAELHAKYGYDYTGIQLDYEPVAFARAMAKIAYAFAVLRLGFDRITDRYVLPSVLDGTIGIGQWVGCDNSEPVGASIGLHALTLQLIENEIHVYVRLFAQFNAPEYHVIVGRIR